MQLSISKTNDVCQSLLDNLELDALIPSPPADADMPPLYSAKCIKNTRRHMEDRHIIIDDFNTLFGLKVKQSDNTRIMWIMQFVFFFFHFSFRNRIEPVIMAFSMDTVAPMQPRTVCRICIVKLPPVNIIQNLRPKRCGKHFSRLTTNSLQNP